MISRSLKTIFVHINKTGGTSVESAFVIQRDMRFSDQILPWQIREKVGSTDWDKSFKFAFVRNPWDRFVSEYFFRRDSNLCPRFLRHSLPFEAFVQNRLEMLQNPSSPQSEIIRFRSQILWLTDKNGDLVVDYIGTFEDIAHSFDYVCQRIGTKLRLNHHNATKHEHYTKYYNDETYEIVRNLHLEDIEAFGYEFGSPAKQVPIARQKWQGWNPSLRIFL